MNDIMLKTLYREAYNFLASVDDNDLKAKLICPISTRAKGLKDLYRRLLNALITKKINEAIGGVDCLCEPFFGFTVLIHYLFRYHFQYNGYPQRNQYKVI